MPGAMVGCNRVNNAKQIELDGCCMAGILDIRIGLHG